MTARTPNSVKRKDGLSCAVEAVGIASYKK